MILKKLIKYTVMYLTMLVPRNRRLYVFGAWLGKRFSDNSRVLFLEACARPDIRAVWVASDPRVVEEVRALGCEAYLMNSFKGIMIQLRARYAVVTNGISDVNHTFMGGATFIDLWHGVPLKKIGYDDTYNTGLSGRAGSLRRKLQKPVLGREYVFATSETFRSIYGSAFGVDDSHVITAGQPRNDLFTAVKLTKDCCAGTDAREVAPAKKVPAKLEEWVAAESDRPAMRMIDEARAEGRRVILYAPTHRLEGAGHRDIDQLLGAEELDRVLGEQNALLLVRRHFYHSEEENCRAYANITDITAEKLDTQLLLLRTDLLVTDYSSIYIDYLLLDRPMVFYDYDREDYLASDREMYFDYDSVTPGPKAETPEELRAEIVRVLEGIRGAENGACGSEAGRTCGSDEADMILRRRALDLFYAPGSRGISGEAILDLIASL